MERISKKKRNTRNIRRKNLSRTRKGGARGENLRFRYTKNIERVIWTEAIYPYSAQLISLPSKIPWSTYSFQAPTEILYPSLDEVSLLPQDDLNEEELNIIASRAIEIKNNNGKSNNGKSNNGKNNNGKNNNGKSNNGKNNEQKEEENTGLANIQFSPENEAQLKLFEMEVQGYRLKEVEAKCVEKPYFIFGGAACEVYNARFQKEGGPNLYANVDPTGDMDISLRPLEVKLIGEEAENEQNTSRKAVMINHDKHISLLYDHYTHWLFDRVVEILRPIAAQMKSKGFYPKTTEGDNELQGADLQEQLDNVLITRAITKNMIKIQCGVGVKDEQGNKKADHFCEFVLTINNDMIFNAEKKYTPPIRDVFTIDNIPTPGAAPIFVEGPVALVNHQAHGLNDRAKIASDPDYAPIIYKLYNHYERILFALNLCVFLKEKGLLETGPGTLSLMNELTISLLTGKYFAIHSPCFQGCDLKKIIFPLKIIIGNEITNELIQSMKQKFGKK